MKGENVTEIDLSGIISGVSKNKGFIVKTMLAVVVLTIIVSFVLPKTYESNSVIHLGNVGGGVYTVVEVKNIILSSDILLPVKNKFFGDKISFDEFKKKYVEVNLVLERVGLAENKEVPLVTVSARARTAQNAVDLNQGILDNFLSYVNPEIEKLINLKEEELEITNKDIQRIENSLAIFAYEISILKKSLGEQEISRILILRNTTASLESGLLAKQNLKYHLENVLAKKRDFKIISSPQLQDKPIFPKLILNIFVSIILGLLLSFLVVLSRGKNETQ
ncbi:MAG: hypothetical protein HQ402_01410 [Parcubacteria group bacterium]|nr:hypothetical protein [Parcubacteria group bacterium]